MAIFCQQASKFILISHEWQALKRPEVDKILQIRQSDIHVWKDRERWSLQASCQF
jgi:hypothetical protein